MKYLFIFLFAISACTQKKATVNMPSKGNVDLSTLSKATFASGCFWCVEAVYESVRGVEEVVSGYSGGNTQNPTYATIGTGTTGHAETVEVYYDSTKVSFKDLLRVYFNSQNPTQVNGQGPDRGSQYRSIVFYRNDTEKALAQEAKAEIQKSFSAPIAAEIKAFEKFWKAEDYHQDFVRLNPTQGYVLGESIPRMLKAQAKFPDLLK